MGSATPRAMYRRRTSGRAPISISRESLSANGIYKAAVVDKQPGCATLLQRMMQLDPSIEQEWHP
jgi:hypothetical protein